MAKRMSPVIRAECRFCGTTPEFLHVGVWFKDKDEFDKFIGALIALRDTVGDDFDHVHLQQHNFTVRNPVGGAEVIFFRPGRRADEIENEMIDKARDWIGEATSHST